MFCRRCSFFTFFFSFLQSVQFCTFFGINKLLIINLRIKLRTVSILRVIIKIRIIIKQKVSTTDAADRGYMLMSLSHRMAYGSQT